MVVSFRNIPLKMPKGTWYPTKFDFQTTFILEIFEKYTFSIASKFSEKKFLKKSNLFRDQTCLGTIQGVVSEEETNSYLNLVLHLVFLFFIVCEKH